MKSARRGAGRAWHLGRSGQPGSSRRDGKGLARRDETNFAPGQHMRVCCLRESRMDVSGLFTLLP
eukprot:11802606-Alexandrium_andersonii.AAC.1